MSNISYFVGDTVYIYSTSLDEIITGIIEGFEDSGQRVKVLQSVMDVTLRHVVSSAYVFDSELEAIAARDEYYSNHRSSNIDYRAGYTVHLHNGFDVVRDNKGNPVLYQITAVYTDLKKVSLVTSYGESIGTFDIDQIRYVNDKPIFTKDNYFVNSRVVWLSGDEVYEGEIIKLHESQAEISNIKKLYPVDYKKRVPYYKLSNSQEEYTSSIIHTIIGDTL